MGFFTPQAVKRNAANQPQRSIAAKNVRVVEQIFPQEAPDPIRDGAVPTRPARNQVVTFFADMENSQDWRFQATNPDYYAGASAVPGRMMPWDQRVNTAPPSHVAYGSLFTQESGY